jgi:NAD(P) transhydrogenase
MSIKKTELEKLHYDLIVIGSGPAGRRAAISLAKRKKKVLIVENRHALGGGCLHTGTIPSKTIRETSLSVSRYYSPQKNYDENLKRKKFSMLDIRERLNRVTTSETLVIQSQLSRNNVDVTFGTGSLLDKNTVKVVDENGDVSKYKSGYILIATGSSPNRPKNIPFDDDVICDSDSILKSEEIPKSLIICGAGVIGSEYASIFAAMGTKVHLINRHNCILNFIDKDMRMYLGNEMKTSGVTMHSSVEILEIKKTKENKAYVKLNNGVELEAGKLLFSMGRNGNTDNLGLGNVGIKIEKYGLIKVNKHYQTSVDNIYACGDVIGNPSLASVSAEQGRIAAHHIQKIPHEPVPERFPYGIFTIPEISYVGKTEGQCIEEKIPFIVGMAYFKEVSRGQIRGVTKGQLKIIMHKESLKVLGVHIIGYSAAELIHIGQAVISYNGKINYFIDNVFNYPTFAEAYKVAALNAINQLPESNNIYPEIKLS